MDRRAFLTGVGTIGAASAAGWATVEHEARSARAAGLAAAAGVPHLGPVQRAAQRNAARPGLSVGYLLGSATLLDYTARGQRWDYLANQMRWATWYPSLSLPVFHDRLDVAIGKLQSAQVEASPNLTRSLEVVAHFALDVSPHFAPFNAWRYDGAIAGKRARATSPLAFEAGMPDRVGLQVNYAFDRGSLVPGLAESGVVYLPIGARNGPGTGIYVLASPSRVTGALPDFTEYRFSGDLIAPLIRNTAGTPDFDFVTLTIAPVAA